MTTKPQPEALVTVIALLRRDRQALADSERSYGDEPFSAEARDWLAEYDDAIKAVESLHAECEALRAELDAQRVYARVLCKAVDAATDFAGTVAGGASWWDDVWSEHYAALGAARSRISDAARAAKEQQG